MKRALVLLTFPLLLGITSPAFAAKHKTVPAISVTAGKVSLSSAGGKVTIRAALKTTTGKCAWSSTPKVKGFPATVNCAKALSRAISLPKNTGKDSRSYVAKLTRLSTPKLAATARVTVLSKTVALVAALGSIHSTLESSSSSTGSARASIDPTYTQDKANPLKVTFDFSASETDGALPNGVLSFYWGSTPQSQSLACSINVGGATTGGQCTITFPAYGPEYVTTTYASGTNSATETDEENIVNPNPVVTTTTVAGPLATTTAVSASYVAQNSITGTLTFGAAVVGQSLPALTGGQIKFTVYDGATVIGSVIGITANPSICAFQQQKIGVIGPVVVLDTAFPDYCNWGSPTPGIQWPLADAGAITVTASYVAPVGWASSTSSATPVTSS